MRTITAAFMLMSLVSCAALEPSDQQAALQAQEHEPRQTLDEMVFTKSELPSGGRFIDHPNQVQVIYYFTNRGSMFFDEENGGKHPGLYKSEDGGTTWKMNCHFFEFTDFLVHPDTNKLYAVIQYTWLDEDSRGYLLPHYSNKLLVSNNGKHWRDITGERGHISRIISVHPDPDHPGRVCLSVNMIRSYVYQAKDDTYSGWVMYRTMDWLQRHDKSGQWIE